MSSFVSKQMFLSCERFSTLHAVIRSIRLNTHVQFDVSIEVLPATVGLWTALVGTMKNRATIAVSPVYLYNI